MKIRFNTFDSVPLPIGNQAFRNFVTSQKAYCRSVTGSLGLQVPIAEAKLVIGYSLLSVVIAFLTLRKFLQNYAFCDVTKLRNAGLPTVIESIGLNRIFANKGNREKRFGHLFITSSCSHFFNKTDFEQYLFKNILY